MRGQLRMLRIHTAVIGVLLVVFMGLMPAAGFAQDVKATDKPAQEPSELFWAALEEARWGEAEAQYMVANMYEKGEGVEKDPKEAASWYEKAADQGHPYSMYKLADMYEKGEGVAKDDAKAAEWFKKAAESGAAKADDPGYSAQLRQMEVGAMKARYDRELVEEDRKYQDQVRRENQRHQERMQNNRLRYDRYYGGYGGYGRGRSRGRYYR